MTAYGVGGLIKVAPGPVSGNGAPASSFKGQLGQQYFDTSQTPPAEYVYNGSTWVSGGNAQATETVAGIAELSTAAEALAGTDDTTIMTPAKVALVAIAGAPLWSEVTAGIVEKASTAEAQAGVSDDVGMSALKVFQALATPPAIGSTTPAAATFTSLTTSGGTVSLGGTSASNFTLTGAVDLTLASSAGSIVVNAGEAAADAIDLNAASGGLDVDVALLASITSTRNNAQAILLEATLGGIDILASGASAGEDIDIVATGSSVNISATENAADSITIVSTAGGIDITAAGAATEDIDITNTAGSIKLTSGEAVADSMVFASSGGIDADAVGQVNIASSQNAADSIVITSSAGGIDILAAGAAAGEDIDIVATGSSVNIESTEDAALAVYLHANGGTSETIRVRADQGTGVASVDVLSDDGGITLTAGLGSADAINLVTSNAGGGIDIDSGTAGFIVDTTGAFSIDGAAASNVTTTGAGIDLTLSSVLGSVLVSSTEDAALAIMLHANGGTSETIRLRADQGTGVASIDVLSDVGGITLTAGLGTADAINLVTSNAAGGIDVDAGTSGFIVDTTGAFSIDGAAASNVTTTGAGIDLTLSSVLGSVLVSSTEDAALAIRLHADGGTSETIQIHSDQGTGVASVGLLSDVGGLTLRATGLASADAINLEAAAGGIDVDAALQINIASSQNAADAVRILASAGGIDVDAVGAAGEDIVITNTGGSVSLVATEAAADAIVLNASNAAGGIDLSTGGGSVDISSAGFATVVAATDTQASPSATATINANVGRATFTGFTTAAAGTQTFVITNSVVTTSSCVLVSVCNEGANDAQMTITRVTRAAGSLSVATKNNGAAALNGNVAVNFWVLTA